MTSVIVNQKAPDQTLAQPAREGRKLYHLQALRGLAASLVVISHSVEALTQRQLIPVAATRWMASAGYFGVATFFIISGFIIYKTSGKAFGDIGGMRQFLLKRVIRIFPIYWIATAIFIALSPHRASYSIVDIVFSALLIPHLITSAGNMHPLVGQGWTLQYEVLFYAIFAAGLLLNRRLGQPLIIAAIVALVAYGAWLMPLADASEPLTVLLYWTRPIMLLFVIGIAFAMAEKLIRPRLDIPHPFLAMTALIALWFIYAWAFHVPPEHQQQLPNLPVIWLLCALCVFVSIFGQASKGFFEPAAEAFGDASYSVYLFHAFILSALLRLKVQDISPALFIVAAVIGANVFGLVLYAMVEKPILTSCRQLLTIPRPARWSDPSTA